IVKDTFVLINLEADACILIDVRAEVSSCTRGVHVNFSVDPKIQQRDAVRKTILAHCGKTAAMPSYQCLHYTLVRHGPVCATDLRRAHSDASYVADILIKPILANKAGQ